MHGSVEEHMLGMCKTLDDLELLEIYLSCLPFYTKETWATIPFLSWSSLTFKSAYHLINLYFFCISTVHIFSYLIPKTFDWTDCLFFVYFYIFKSVSFLIVKQMQFFI